MKVNNNLTFVSCLVLALCYLPPLLSATAQPQARLGCPEGGQARRPKEGNNSKGVAGCSPKGCCYRSCLALPSLPCFATKARQGRTGSLLLLPPSLAQPTLLRYQGKARQDRQLTTATVKPKVASKGLLRTGGSCGKATDQARQGKAEGS